MGGFTSVPEVGFAAVPTGGRVAYASAGEGPPLVMVPGWLSHVRELWNHRSAAAALAQLSEGHRFIWWDRLGCGMSDRHLAAPSLEDDVAQLTAVLDALGIERCDLLGYSFGGPPAVLFAHRHPERVRNLVLYSTYARGSDLADEEMFAALVDLVRAGWETAAVMLAGVFIADGSADDRRWFSKFQRVSCDASTAAELLAYVRRQDVTDLIGELRIPVTVVSSERDPVVASLHANTLAQGIPGPDSSSWTVRPTTPSSEATVGSSRRSSPGLRTALWSRGWRRGRSRRRPPHSPRGSATCSERWSTAHRTR